MKRIFFLVGIGFLGLAFVGAAVEVAARAMSPDLGWLPSIGVIWATIAPAHFEAFLAANPWSGWRMAVDQPSWVLFGIPGFALIVVFRDRAEDANAEHEASLFLFDELAKRAKEDGFDDLGDDITSSDYADLHAADQSYAQDLSSDDLTAERDYLLGEKNAPRPTEPQDER